MTLEPTNEKLKSAMTSDSSEQLRTEFNEWARAGKGDSMERGHRPVGEQALALMNVPADARLTADLARSVGVRTGSAAVLEGSIAIARWKSGNPRTQPTDTTAFHPAL